MHQSPAQLLFRKGNPFQSPPSHPSSAPSCFPSASHLARSISPHTVRSAITAPDHRPPTAFSASRATTPRRNMPPSSEGSDLADRELYSIPASSSTSTPSGLALLSSLQRGLGFWCPYLCFGSSLTQVGFVGMRSTTRRSDRSRSSSTVPLPPGTLESTRSTAISSSTGTGRTRPGSSLLRRPASLWLETSGTYGRCSGAWRNGGLSISGLTQWQGYLRPPRMLGQRLWWKKGCPVVCRSSKLPYRRGSGWPRRDWVEKTGSSYHLWLRTLMCSEIGPRRGGLYVESAVNNSLLADLSR